MAGMGEAWGLFFLREGLRDGMRRGVVGGGGGIWGRLTSQIK